MVETFFPVAVRAGVNGPWAGTAAAGPPAPAVRGQTASPFWRGRLPLRADDHLQGMPSRDARGGWGAGVLRPCRPDWQEVTIDLGTEGILGTMRLYLPATSDKPVEIDSIELKPAKGNGQKWDF